MSVLISALAIGLLVKPDFQNANHIVMPMAKANTLMRQWLQGSLASRPTSD